MKWIHCEDGKQPPGVKAECKVCGKLIDIIRPPIDCCCPEHLALLYWLLDHECKDIIFNTAPKALLN